MAAFKDRQIERTRVRWKDKLKGQGSDGKDIGHVESQKERT